MANLNKVMLIGRLTRDPEVRTFANGGKVCAIGFAVNNRKKDAGTGQWVDDPVFLDLEAFNRGENGHLADLCEQMRKGQQVYFEGHLKLDQWTDKEGQKRSKVKIVVDQMQYLEPKGEGGTSPAQQQRQPARANGRPSQQGGGYGGDGGGYDGGPDPGYGAEDNIPF